MCKDVQRQTESATSIIREDKTFHQTERKTFNHTAWRFVRAVSYSLLQGMWISLSRKSLSYWALQSVCITFHCFPKPGGIVPISGSGCLPIVPWVVFAGTHSHSQDCFVGSWQKLPPYNFLHYASFLKWIDSPRSPRKDSYHQNFQSKTKNWIKNQNMFFIRMLQGIGTFLLGPNNPFMTDKQPSSSSSFFFANYDIALECEFFAAHFDLASPTN